jgi:beta-fructofuranosidase
MLDQKGRRILVAWMGLPEIEYPTDKHGWAHCLTLPRELTIRNNKLIQTPVKELQELRGEKVEAEAIIYCDSITLEGFYGETFELIAEFTDSTAEEFGVELRVGGNEKTILKYNKKIKKILFDRSFSGQPVANEFGKVRKCGINSQDIKFHVFADASSIEVFINDGEEVFTGRIFPGKESRGIRFFANGGQVNLKAIKWVINQNKKD